MHANGASRMAAALASLVLVGATLFVGAGPAVAGQANVASETIGVVDVQGGDEAITFDGLRALLNQFEATGEVTRGGAARLQFLVDFAESYYDRVGCAAGRFAHAIDLFKQYASDPRYVPSESAQDQLVSAADRLFAKLCGTSADQR